MDLIKEARERGYRKGTKIHYYPEKNTIIDEVIGDVFEVLENGDLVAYLKEESERVSFDDFTYDTLYEKDTDTWVKIL